MMTHRILILGGTTEARMLAGKLSERAEFDVTLSLAGRTEKPVDHPVPLRSGGFGGADGLAAYLKAEKIDLLIDATHPYAAQISRNAAEASLISNTPIIALRRPAWEQVQGDRWTLVDDASGAIEALGDAPRHAFLALGRQEVAQFSQAPQHFYVIRSVDPIEPPLDVPNAEYILDRGPFQEAAELRLLKDRGIDATVAKNSGGSATYGKIAAARLLGISVILFRRPALPDTPSGKNVAEVMALIDHAFEPAKKRGV